MKVTRYKGWTITELNEPSQEALDAAHEVLQHAFNVRIEELRRQKLGGVRESGKKHEFSRSD